MQELSASLALSWVDHLDGSGAHGKGSQAVVGRVAGEVHEDVDLVAAHELRQVGLAQRQHIAPEAAGSFHRAAQPRRLGVRARDAAVDDVPHPA